MAQPSPATDESRRGRFVRTAILGCVFIELLPSDLRTAIAPRPFGRCPNLCRVQTLVERAHINPELKDKLKIALIAIAFAGLLVGLGLTFAGYPALARGVWAAGVIPVLAALLVEIVESLRRGEVGLDIVAALSMSAALLFGETLAAAVVALMYSGGTFLESFAEGRARREMSDLLSRVPRTATRHRNGALEEVPLDEIAPGDLLLIRQGDVAPVDGTVEVDRGDARPVGPDRRVDARAAGPRPGGDERLDQRGRRLRPRASRRGGGQHLCRHRPAGRGGAALEGADVAAGRPLLARCSSRSPSRWRQPPGGSPATRSARWRCWSWRRHAR